MVDIALILANILTKKTDFRFEMNSLRTPLDIFALVNPLSDFPKVSRNKGLTPGRNKKNDQDYTLSVASRVVALFGDQYRFLSGGEPGMSNVDVELGVPPNFNPNDENFSSEDLNKQLENSIYDFILR